MQNLRLAVHMGQTKNNQSPLQTRFLDQSEEISSSPCQNITYIGAFFPLEKGIVCPTLERIVKIFQVIQLLKQEPTAQNFLHLLGLVTSCIGIVPHALLFMRPVQLHLLHYWRPISPDLQTKIPINSFLADHLKRWKRKENSLRGKPYAPLELEVLTTDASKPRFGSHLNNQNFQGLWSEREKTLLSRVGSSASINKAFSSTAHRSNVLIRSDSVAVVQYINKQGGTRSQCLYYQTCKLWKIAIKQNLVEGSASGRSLERSGGPIIESGNTSDGMVFRQQSRKFSVHVALK